MKTGFIDAALKRGGLIEVGDLVFTRGPWAHGPSFISLPEGTRLVGQGTTLSEIRLLNPVRRTGEKPRPDMRIIHAGSWTQISDLSLAAPSTEDGQFFLVTAGIRGRGQGIHVRRVHVNNLLGCLTPHPMDGLQHEAFGISFDPGWGSHVVEDCMVAGEKDAYLSAFSGQAGANSMVLFNRCRAVCEMGYAAFTLYDNTVVRDGESATFGYSIYNDTGSVRDASVEGGAYTSSRVAIGFVGDAGTVHQWIRIRDARFMLMGVGSVGLELVSRKPGALFRNIEIVGCRFINLPASRFTLFSSNAEPAGCSGICFRNCVFPTSTVTNARGVPFSLVDCQYENGLRVTTLPSVS